MLASVNRNPPATESVASVSPIMGTPAVGTVVVKPTFGSVSHPPFPAVAEKEEGEWQIVFRVKGKLLSGTSFHRSPHS